MDNENTQQFFRFFTEIGIISQLSRAVLEAQLPTGLTTTHFGILNHLSRRPEGCTPLQLATSFQQPKTTMTHMLKVLEKNNCITIRPNAADGRSKLVQITQTGSALIQNTVAAMMPAIVKAINPEVVSAIEKALPNLEVIRASLDAARET